ncbi:MAG: LysE family translocator [Gammaproteobacteria bacterium]
MTLDTLLTFIAASALLSFAPGPDNIFVLMQSAMHGRRAGFFITLGLCTGLLVHTTLVALGVAALLVLSATAFLVLKLVGATYLVYLAVLAWRASASVVAGSEAPPLSPRQHYLRGIAMNLSNPKVAIFFLAFLPQFARPEAGGVTAQLIVLGGIFIAVALAVFSLIAALAGWLAGALARSAQAQIQLNRLAALVFFGLAARLALSSR